MLAIAEHRALSALIGEGLAFEAARKALAELTPAACMDGARYFDPRDISRAARYANGRGQA